MKLYKLVKIHLTVGDSTVPPGLQPTLLIDKGKSSINVDEDSDSEVCSQRRIKKQKRELLKSPIYRARKCAKKPWSNAEKSALFPHFTSPVFMKIIGEFDLLRIFKITEI